MDAKSQAMDFSMLKSFFFFFFFSGYGFSKGVGSEHCIIRFV
jgi:hypothetical protein